MPSDEQRQEELRLQKKVDGLRRELSRRMVELATLHDRMDKATSAFIASNEGTALARIINNETIKLQLEKDNLIKAMEAIAVDIEVATKTLEELKGDA
jgi:CII-binding regulator of phage lambda lysogenization HflD